MTTFIVRSVIGANRDRSKGVREQPLWDEHAAFVDGLFDAGHILLGGPYTDGTGALLIVQMDTDDPAAVKDVFDRDPWSGGGIQHVAEVKRWDIFLDARAR
jgi:uncharacterized protein YciI